MEDEKIIDMFLARDEDAIKHTAAKYGRSIRKIAFNVCGDEYDAEECENDTYFTAWNNIPPHEPRDYFFPFLAKIARSKALNRVRALSAKKRKAEFVELSSELEECMSGNDSVDEAVDSKALGRAVNDYLRKISEEKRIIFMRRYFFFDSVSDISGRLGISEGKVKSVLFRTRNDLKDYLEKEGWNI